MVPAAREVKDLQAVMAISIATRPLGVAAAVVVLNKLEWSWLQAVAQLAVATLEVQDEYLLSLEVL